MTITGSINYQAEIKVGNHDFGTPLNHSIHSWDFDPDNSPGVNTKPSRDCFAFDFFKDLKKTLWQYQRACSRLSFPKTSMYWDPGFLVSWSSLGNGVVFYLDKTLIDHAQPAKLVLNNRINWCFGSEGSGFHVSSVLRVAIGAWLGVPCIQGVLKNLFPGFNYEIDMDCIGFLNRNY